jgi:hypothetical protein
MNFLLVLEYRPNHTLTGANVSNQNVQQRFCSELSLGDAPKVLNAFGSAGWRIEVKRY